ncbi:MAG: ABC transporter ATP-binding protein [Gemmatimonadales bacterium]|nr:ABC transporter ATP-binding protein [Gemmatimonadales bacterium]
MPPFLSIAGLTKQYRGSTHPAVNDLAFTLDEGEILVLLGSSGCGKSTTLRLIAGFERPDSGKILLRGRDLVAGRVPPERRGIGFVFQDLALFPHLTVSANVGFGLTGSQAAHRGDQVQSLLRQCGVGRLGDRYPHEISGGEQQRVALARAIAPANALILLDEPLSNVDAENRSALRQEIRRILKQAGRTAIVVTHDREEAFDLADRVAVMNEGRIEQAGPVEEVYHRPVSRTVATFLGPASFLRGTVSAEGVVCELGVLSVDGGGEVGRPVEVLLRPQALSVTPDANGPGVILGQTFRGASRVYHVRLESGTELRCAAKPSLHLAVDQRVAVQADADQAAILPL